MKIEQISGQDPAATPATHREVHYGGRLIRCFVDRPESVDQMLREAAAHNPEGVAIVDGERRYSYAELDASASEVACGLIARGIRPGDRVALLLRNRLEFVEALFGAIRAGAIVVPMNVREQRPELEVVLRHSGAKVLIHEPDLVDRLPPEIATLTTRIVVGPEQAGSIPFAALYESNVRALVAYREDDPAIILYTSGTTGQPKAAMLTHLSLVSTALNFEHCWQLTAADRTIMAVPASHVTGIAAVLMTMVRVCGTTVMLREFKAAEFLALAMKERMTYAILVPAMYNLCLLQSDLDLYDMSHWRVAAYGGSPMPEATIEAVATWMPHAQLVNAYGATETTSPSTLTPLSEGRSHRDTVGIPVPCAEICIMDESGREVGPGAPGEIWIKGPHVVPGYWGDDAETAARFSDGYWRSGDVGSMSEDGYLRILDRTKDMINRGGFKVYSAEVEAVLISHPSIQEAAVVAAHDPVLGEKVHAYVLPKQPGLTVADVRLFCSERLSDYMVPDFVTFVAQPLPRGPTGKVLKRALRQPGPEQSSPSARKRGVASAKR